MDKWINGGYYMLYNNIYKPLKSIKQLGGTTLQDSPDPLVGCTCAVYTHCCARNLLVLYSF